MSGMITSLISNPTVGYRLDPGEPGVAPPATAATSAYTVTAQESRNRTRLASKAMLEGRDVLLVKTDYKVARVGSFNVIVGGLTTVVTRDRPDQATPLQQATADKGAKPAQPTPEQSAAPKSPQKVAELRTEQRRLQQEQKELKAEQTDRSDPSDLKAAQAKARLAEIEQRLREIRVELRRQRAEAATGNASPATAFAANGFTAALDQVGQLLDLVV